MKRKYISAGDNPYTYSLTDLEYNALSLLHTGMTNIEIAERLGTTCGTIKTRLFAAYKKIGAKNRAQAAILFRTTIENAGCTTTGGNNDGPKIFA